MSRSCASRPVLAGCPWLACLASLLLALAPAAQAEWRDIPYADIARMPLVLAGVDPRRIFTVEFLASPGKGFTALPADFQLRIKLADRLIPVTMQPEGRINLPIRKDWAEAGAVLQSNQLKGRVAVSLNLNSRTPPGTRMGYSQLMESVPVMERGIKEMAGMMSFLAPKVRQLALRFEKGQQQTVTLVLAGGDRKQWKTDAQGKALVPWEPRWLKGTIELSAPLQGIDQILK